MMIDEAIRILDPESSKDALLPYAYDSYQRRKVVDEACRVAVDELRKQQWISVKDRLPEICQDVLVYCKNTQRVTIGRFAHWYDNDGWDIVGTKGRFNDIVTHWMPMPEPPKEGVENA